MKAIYRQEGLGRYGINIVLFIAVPCVFLCKIRQHHITFQFSQFQNVTKEGAGGVIKC